jgi:hypothetical protein
MKSDSSTVVIMVVCGCLFCLLLFVGIAAFFIHLNQNRNASNVEGGQVTLPPGGGGPSTGPSTGPPPGPSGGGGGGYKEGNTVYAGKSPTDNPSVEGATDITQRIKWPQPWPSAPSHPDIPRTRGIPISRQRPMIIMNMCNMQDAAKNPDQWTSVRQRLDGLWANGAGTPDWPDMVRAVKNKNIHFEILTYNIVPGNDLLGVSLMQMKDIPGVKVAHATWYHGDDIQGVKTWNKETAQRAVRTLNPLVSPNVTVITTGHEWSTARKGAIDSAEYQIMSDPGCMGTTLEYPWQCAISCNTNEMPRMIEFCRKNNKVSILLCHIDLQPGRSYLQDAKAACEHWKKNGDSFPDYIVLSNYGGPPLLKGIPEGSGSDYPETMTGVARFLLDYYNV